jgi:DNA-binding response OmpR family regulator
LRHFGYQVDSVATYESAVTALDHSRFQILLSDIALPDGDGCNLVNEAKHKQQNLFAVALTARADSRDIERGRVAGFDHYLTKPCDMSELRFVLGSWAKQRCYL